MPTDPRWTPDTEELVALAIHVADKQCVFGWEECRAEGQHRRATLEVLTALADAQLLLPVGGETREDWMVEVDLGDGWRPSPFIATAGRAPQPVYAGDIDAYMRGIVKPKRKLRRTVHTGPWHAVDAPTPADTAQSATPEG